MLAVISAAVAPAIALLSFFYLKDKYETEPLSMVVRVYLFGLLLVFPVMVLQYGFEEELHIAGWVKAFFVSGLFEEFLKWFLVFYSAYLHAEFNEPYDGIVYSTALSLGFASLENVFYLSTYGIQEAFWRALLPVSGHALFGVIMGYYLGRAKFSRGKKQRMLLLLSLFLPALLHGVYNYILMTAQEDMFLAIIPFMVFLWWLGLRKVKLANEKRVAYLSRQ
ncbi:glutamic-type intramembrane protease PrsW [Fictibacillus aquaticus]|uniref:Protease PrsW n=1 Tax=Fictibacillus aquaticus TaxID=2021314 RepID=A0A235FB81_9BACL|nr:glutamic-type intramembrane protease PrsW [Fictibacillus aquaticus]OYD58502.1 PrsW family intramembrane metalloprotease [Fictibacillus aquaticus]